MPDISGLMKAATAADDRARRARAEAARLRREIERAKAAQVLERHRLIGGAVLAWCASDDRVRQSTQRYLGAHLAAIDAALLRGKILNLFVQAAEGIA